MAKEEKIKPDEIDASFVISSFKNKERRNNPSSEPKPLVPEHEKQKEEQHEEENKEVSPPNENKRKKRGRAGYRETFVRRNEIKTRECVYISRDIHTKIVKLVRALEDTNITIGGYIDIVLSEHLEQNKKEINEIFRQSRRDLL